MNRQLSPNNHRNVSGEKVHKNFTPNLTDVCRQPNINNLPYHYKDEAPKSKQKEVKNKNKIAKQKDRFQNTGPKLQSDQKQYQETYGLCMKTELKHKLKKTKAEKSKNKDSVAALFKAIQKRRKELQQTQHKPYRFQEKANSQHSFKVQKQKRTSSQSKRSGHRSKSKRKLQDGVVLKKQVSPEIEAFGIQISLGQAQRVKIQQKQKNHDKSTPNTDLDKNLLELCKMYKKIHEAENAKVQAQFQNSNKKTSYNTNQSKNSCAHHNLHIHWRTARSKVKDEEKPNIEKIVYLIRKQQLKTHQEQGDILENHSNVCRQRNKGGKLLQNRSQRYHKRMLFSKLDKAYRGGNDSSNEAELDCEQNVGLAQLLKNVEKDESVNKSELKQIGLRIQKKYQVKVKNNEDGMGQLQKKFYKSKFYVPLVPKLQPKQITQKQDEQQKALLFGLNQQHNQIGVI